MVEDLVPPLMDIVWELLSSQHSARPHFAKVSVGLTLNVPEAKENIWGSLINFLVVPRYILCYGILGSIFKFLLSPRSWGSLDFQVRWKSRPIPDHLGYVCSRLMPLTSLFLWQSWFFENRWKFGRESSENFCWFRIPAGMAHMAFNCSGVVPLVLFLDCGAESLWGEIFAKFPLTFPPLGSLLYMSKNICYYLDFNLFDLKFTFQSLQIQLTSLFINSIIFT